MMKAKLIIKPLIASFILIVSMLLLSSCGRSWEATKEGATDLREPTMQKMSLNRLILTDTITDGHSP